EAADSPVHQLLPALSSQDPEALLVVPGDFQEELRAAAAAGRLGDLALLAGEVAGLGFEWERSGLRLVGRAQFSLRDWTGARGTWERVREIRPDDPEANLRLGTVHQRLGDLDASDRALRRALACRVLERSERAEAEALLGRNAKARWIAAWEAAPEGGARRAALQSPWLRRAIEHYALGFAHDLNHYYSGINALALVTVLLDLAAELEREWADAFPSDDRARVEQGELAAERARLEGAVALALRAAEAAGGADEWHALTAAEHALLTSEPPRAGWVGSLYRGAAAAAGPFARSSAADQLRFYRALGVRSECVDAGFAALAAIGAPGPPGRTETEMPSAETAGPPERVLLFTGHRIDAPGRETPRFPRTPEAEAKARAMIREAVEAELAEARGRAGEAAAAPVKGIAGAASGGDVLFHEVCRDLGIPTEVYLALPRDRYVEKSVADSGPEWVRRFDRLHDELPVRVLGEGTELPRWLRGAAKAADYSVWQRSNLWMLEAALEAAPDAGRLTLIALWDGQAGDGPGGTAHMIESARARGARTIVLPAGELLEPEPR
ncbi:MAG TPA: tetratricopeptide repeat-containing protein, partial [Thermoanaerobaculia bacterium]